MLKRTPFFDLHNQVGGKIVEFAGFEMPVHYKGIKIEHAAVRHAVGVFDVSHMGEFFVSGDKALDLIQKVTVNDASKLYPGKAQYSCFCYADGGIVDDLIVYMLAENEYMLVVNGANVDKDFAWIKSQNSMGAELVDRSDDYALLAVQGPKAKETLQKLTETNLDEIGFYCFKSGELAGLPMIISATGYTGEKGFELYFKHANADVEGIWGAIFSAGNEFGIEPCGLGARDTLRLEMGFALYGNDLTANTHPLEARLGWITKFGKGTFVGKEALLAKKEAGLKRQLVGFMMDDERAIPRNGYEIFNAGGIKIGHVTSGTMSITLGKGIGMGFVEKDQASEGSTIEIAIRNKMAKATITQPPFIKK
jgi:aminomethyltransferase